MKLKKNGGARERRLAEAIARSIELDIIGEDLAPGTMVGSEAELMVRFQASRGVIREAVCLVESHMLAATQRGIGGGLIVVEPDQSIVEGAVSLYLARKKASEAELVETRLALEHFAMHKAMSSLDDEGRNRLREEMTYEPDETQDIAEASQRFHLLLAELAGNTVIELFVGTMTTLVEELWTPPGTMTPRVRSKVWRRVCAEHNAIMQAMLDGDEELALERLDDHLTSIMAQVGPRSRRVQASPLD